jgi:hypothetical protein
MVAGKPRGYPKTGGARLGSITTQTKEVKAAILRVFQEVNENDGYLQALAIDDKRLFLSLLARLIPQEMTAQIEVTHSVNLAQAIQEADQRLEHPHERQPPVIEHNPTRTIDMAPPPVETPTSWEGYE